MKDWFFHQEKGKTLGPINLDEMKSRIREGRIRMFDLVYREGDSGWQMAIEHRDLRADFKSAPVKSLAERPWVVLRRKSEESLDFETSGPFGVEDIRRSLKEGSISYSDYVWRDGFSEWRRIGSLKDFNTRLGTAKETSSAPPDLPAKDLLKNVVEMERRRSGVAPQVPPPEAEGEDLVMAPVKPEVQARPVPPSPKASVPKKAAVKRRSFLSDWIIVAGLAILVGAGVFGVSRYSGEILTSEEPVQPEAASPPPVAQPAQEQIQETPEPVVEQTEPVVPEAKAPELKDMAPTRLSLNVRTVGANQVKIDLRTDGVGEKYPVYLQIVGLPGQVTEGAAFYKLLKLIPKGGQEEPFDLSGLSLPQGKFLLRAETGDLKKEVRMSIGVNEASYKQTMARLRKVHAGTIWKERLELFRLTSLLEKRLTEALSGKKLVLTGLGALQAVKKTNGGNYVFFEEWSELKEILSAARITPSMAQLGRLKQIRDRLSTFSVWK